MVVEIAQAVRRLGGTVTIVEGSARVLPHEAAPLGEALVEVLHRDGIDLALGVRATAAERVGDDYVLKLDDGRELHGDRLLVATGRRRVSKILAWRRSASSRRNAESPSMHICV